MSAMNQLHQQFNPLQTSSGKRLVQIDGIWASDQAAGTGRQLWIRGVSEYYFSAIQIKSLLLPGGKNSLALWKVSIPLVAVDKDKIISLDSLETTLELSAADEISEVFGNAPQAKKTDHVPVQRLLLNQILQADELRTHIFTSIPSVSRERRGIAIEHPLCELFPKEGVFRPQDDYELRAILRTNIQANPSTSTPTLVVSLEFPRKGFLQFTLADIQARLGVNGFGKMEVGRIVCKTKDQMAVLDDLTASLRLAQNSMPFLNEAFDYLIESKLAAQLGMVGVAEVKQPLTFKEGLPQNVAQVEATLSIRIAKTKIDFEDENWKEEMQHVFEQDDGRDTQIKTNPY
ncbi:hypothetical protein EDD21DRAFT_447702 [Dissophora ornata]|nr:hypothetical protein EDD21DRAFT_447702 [Dissophora ornata]